MDISGIVSAFLVDMITDLSTKISEIKDVVAANILSADSISGRPNIFYYTATRGYRDTVNVATTICGVVFLIEFLKITVKLDVLKFEYLFSALFKLCVARLAISIGGTMLGALSSTATSLVGTVSPTTTSDATIALMVATIDTACDGMDLLEAIGLLTTLLIPFIAIKVIGLVGVVLAWGRLIELTIYHVVYPLPCAALCLDNASITRRFMLSYLSVALQGVFMMLSLKIFQTWVTSDITAVINAFGSTDTSYAQISKLVFSLFLACLIMIVTLMKSGQWSQKLCGV